MKNNKSVEEIGQYIVHRLWTLRNDEDRTTGYYILDLTSITSLENGVRVFNKDSRPYKYLTNITRYPAHSGELVKGFVEMLNTNNKIKISNEDLVKVKHLVEKG